jgi:flagellar motility protein MotE (MotC chaperone)
MDALDNGKINKYEREIGEGKNKKKIVVEDTNSNQLTFRVIAYQRFKGWNKPFWGNPDLAQDEMATQLELEWYNAAMTDFVRQVLDHDSALEGDLMTKVKEGLEKWGKENLQDWDKMTLQQKQAEIVAGFGTQIEAMRDSMGLIFKGAKALTRAGASKLAQAPFMQSWDRCRRLAQRVSKESPPKIKDRGLGVSGAVLLTLLSVAGLVASIWGLQDDAGDRPEKTGLLITGLITSITQLTRFGIGVVDSIWKYRIGGQEHLLDSAFQQSISTQLQDVTHRLGYSELQLSHAKDQTTFATGRRSATLTELQDIKWAERSSLKPLRSEFGGLAKAKDLDDYRRQLYQTRTRLDSRLRELKKLTDQQGALRAQLKAEEAALLQKQKEIQEAVAKYKGKYNGSKSSTFWGWASTALQIVGYVVAVASAIFMTWQLIVDWEVLSKDGVLLVLTFIQALISLIEGIMAAVILGVSHSHCGPLPVRPI